MTESVCEKSYPNLVGLRFGKDEVTHLLFLLTAALLPLLLLLDLPPQSEVEAKSDHR